MTEKRYRSTARDIEAHMGEMSLERIAKEKTASILRTSVSWNDLHRRLAEHGFALERKGNGAVLNCCGTFMKLSKVSRECSFSKLEERLGKFEERDKNIVVDASLIASWNGQKNGQTAPEKRGENAQETWERYNAERTAYLDEKSKALRELREAQKKEIKELCQDYRELYAGLFTTDWKGRGEKLKFSLSFIAYIFRNKYTEMREQQKEELDDLKSHYLRRFPSYKQWLAVQTSEDLLNVYRYPGQIVLTPEQSGVIRTPTIEDLDLRDYRVRRGASNSVLYCRGKARTADFSDMGRRIVLDKRKLDETSVTAALQLANQKWGATRIDGSDEYKELCVSVAVKHGLKLANPDLAAELERRRSAARAALRHGDVKEVTEAEIASLRLVDNPRIYINPRTDNQQYRGRIVHVDEERGFCVQLVRRQSLFVHRLERLDVPPKLGEDVKIAYNLGEDKAIVQRQEVQRRVRSL